MRRGSGEDLRRGRLVQGGSGRSGGRGTPPSRGGAIRCRPRAPLRRPHAHRQARCVRCGARRRRRRRIELAHHSSGVADGSFPRHERGRSRRRRSAACRCAGEPGEQQPRRVSQALSRGISEERLAPKRLAQGLAASWQQAAARLNTQARERRHLHRPTGALLEAPIALCAESALNLHHLSILKSVCIQYLACRNRILSNVRDYGEAAPQGVRCCPLPMNYRRMAPK